MTGDPFEQTRRRGYTQRTGCLFTFLGWALILGWWIWESGRKRPEPWEDWTTKTSYVIGCFIVPLVGLIQAMNLKGELEGTGKLTFRVIFFPMLKALAYWLLALGMVVSGGLVMVSQWSVTALLLGGLVAVGGGWLFGVPFKMLAEFAQVQARLRQEDRQRRLREPHFASIESEVNLPIPASYKVMFMLSSDWMKKSWWILPKGPEGRERYRFVQLEPAHAHALRRHPSIDGPLLCFGCGEKEEYWFQLGLSDPPVFRYEPKVYAPTGEVKMIAEHLSEFLKWPKVEAAAEG